MAAQQNAFLDVRHWGTYLLNITLLKGLFGKFIFTGLYPSWSLAVEEVFYLLAPWIFWRLRHTRKMLYVLPVGFLAFGLLLTLLGQHISFYGFFDSLQFLLFHSFFGRCIEFFVGIALAQKLLSGKVLPARYGLQTWGGVLLIVAWMYVSRLLLFIQDQQPLFVILRACVSSFLLPVFGIGLFYRGLLSEKTLLSRLLSTSVFQLLGKSSYAFYLIHTGFFYDLVSKYLKGDLWLFLLLNGVSVLLYRVVEAPLNAWLRRGKTASLV